MPDWKSAIRERLTGLTLDSAREEEIVDEFAQHLEDRYESLLAQGVSETIAHGQALEEISGSKLLEELRSLRRAPLADPIGIPRHRGGLVSGLIPDLKIAFRNMRTKLTFSLMVIGMLALGVAANAAIFSIFNGLFLRPLPFRDADRLIDLDETAPKWNLHYVGDSNIDFLTWRKNNRTFDGMAFFTGSSFNLADHGTAQRILGGLVTHDLLDVLGIKPVLGRGFLPAEDQPDGAKVAMLGYDLWQRLFQGDRGVLGRVVKLNEEPYTVIGVLPREAVLPERAELWVPLDAEPDPKRDHGWYANGIGRLKPGVSMQQAEADLMRIHKALIQDGQKVNEITSPILTPLRDRYLGDYRTVSHILLGGVAVVLLIACVNVAALMMVRGSSRVREIAIRTAIGASRGRIIRQLFTENLVLAAAGGVLGVLLGYLCLEGMLSLMPSDNLPLWISFNMDWRFAAFCIAITGAAAVLSGLTPVLQVSGVDARGALQDAGVRTSLSRGRRLTLGTLVVCEIGLALVLSIGAGLLLEAFHKVLSVDPGFRAENVITFRVNLPETTYKKPEQQIAFFESLVERIRALPGVKSAGATSSQPLGNHNGNFWEAEEQPRRGRDDKNPVVLQIITTPDYFDAIGMTFLEGRPFRLDEADLKFTRTAVVNETFAKYYWPGKNAIGKRIRPQGTKEWIQVAGVTRDEKHYGLDQEMKPGVFLPLRGSGRESMAIVMRGSIDPQTLIAPARAIVRQMDPDLPLYDVRPMTDRVNQSLWARRAYSWLFGAFALIAVMLAAAGIYGVVSYAVSQRTHEIGIRMALGARAGQVLLQTLGGGMLLVLAGLMLGVAGALAVVRVLQALLFGISPRDPAIYGLVILGVAVIGLLANAIPARRAASVDPMRALRCE